MLTISMPNRRHHFESTRDDIRKKNSKLMDRCNWHIRFYISISIVLFTPLCIKFLYPIIWAYLNFSLLWRIFVKIFISPSFFHRESKNMFIQFIIIVLIMSLEYIFVYFYLRFYYFIFQSILKNIIFCRGFRDAFTFLLTMMSFPKTQVFNKNMRKVTLRLTWRINNRISFFFFCFQVFVSRFTYTGVIKFHVFPLPLS